MIEHVPLPLHVPAPLIVDPSHVPGAHGVPAGYRRHEPSPSHVPSNPQVDAACCRQLESRAVAGSDEQVPCLPITLHARHEAPQAWLQQTPSTQKLLKHSVAFRQASPFILVGGASMGMSVAASAGLPASASALKVMSTRTVTPSCTSARADPRPISLLLRNALTSQVTSVPPYWSLR